MYVYIYIYRCLRFGNVFLDSPRPALQSDKVSRRSDAI